MHGYALELVATEIWTKLAYDTKYISCITSGKRGLNLVYDTK